MNYFTKEIQTNEALARTAGVKARDDADAILQQNGWKEIVFAFDTSVENKSALKSLSYHLKNAEVWRKRLDVLNPGDNILIQFPVKNHSVLLYQTIRKAVQRGVNVILLVHDLEIIRAALRDDSNARGNLRISLEEQNILDGCSKIIVHNPSMKHVLTSMGFQENKMIPLWIFDYLIPGFDQKSTSPEREIRKDLPVIIAGNLRRHKAEYVYHLPENCRFNLYGVDYENQQKEHITYFGSFPPDELPFVLKGSFGLVWDGDSAETCSGTYGQYLRINNPHKTSLYLASGLPVIVWKKSAMARFVRKYGVGIAVDSLYDIENAVHALSEEEYAQMLRRVQVLSVRLRDGYYLKAALQEALKQ